MKAVGGDRHLFCTSKILLLLLELNHLIYEHVYFIYICALKAVGVVRHLLYTSKILLIVLKLNHLVYKHVYCIYIYIYIYIRNESSWWG